MNLPLSPRPTHGPEVPKTATDRDRVKDGNGAPPRGHAPDCHPVSATAEDVACQHTALTCPVPLHHHDSYLIAFVLAGSGQHEDESGRLPILAGDVCIVRPGEWHGYPRVHGALTLVNVTLARSYLDACMPLLGEMPWPGLMSARDTSDGGELLPPVHVWLSPLELDRFRPLLCALAEELEDPQSAARPGVRSGLLLQILGLLEFGKHNGFHAQPDGDGDDDGGVLAAIRYLEERYARPLTIEELADQTGYTPTYLTRKFRRRLGVSPTEYLLNLRIRHACTLLRDTNLSIASVASHVGFRDSQYFATRFHRAMGTTPSAFRARARTDLQTS